MENNVYEYKWSSSASCNCGILARTLTGKNPFDCGIGDVPSSLIGPHGAFASKAFCMKSNLPIPEVFQRLKDAGFTYEEMLELELLGNREISNAIGRKVIQHSKYLYYMDSNIQYSNKTVLIQYLKAWVEILKKQFTTYDSAISEILEKFKQTEETPDKVIVPEKITQ